MTNKEFNSDEIFRSKMENLAEEKPSSKDWEVMKARLQAEGLLPSRKRRFGWYLPLSILLIAAIGTGGYFAFNNQTMNAKNGIAANQKVTGEEKIIATQANETGQINKMEETNQTVSDVNENKEGTLKNEDSESATDKEKQPAMSYDKQKNSGGKIGSTANKIPSLKSSEKNTSKNSGGIVKGNIPVNNVKEIPGIVSVLKEGDHVIIEGQPVAVLAANDGLIVTGSDSVSKKEVKDSVTAETEMPGKKQGCFPPRHRNSHKWELGIYSSGDINSLGFNSTDETGRKMVADGIPTGSSFGYSIGLTVDYKVFSNISLEARVMYSQKKKFEYIYKTPAQDNFVYDQYDYSFAGRYLEIIPLKVNFYVLQKHYANNDFSIYFSPGFMTTVNLPAKDNDYFIHTTVNLQGSETNKILLERQSLGFAGLFALGCKLRFNHSWNLFVEPGYQYHFTPVVKNKTFRHLPVEEFVRSWNFAAGLKYDF